MTSYQKFEVTRRCIFKRRNSSIKLMKLKIYGNLFILKLIAKKLCTMQMYDRNQILFVILSDVVTLLLEQIDGQLDHHKMRLYMLFTH
ncbi:hypothetical protein T4D_5780 [Trichinella pseudospiralis]|uniref:Uncharacterized protein n=1 Tax=Trichinella pseudospiralis TaxID=6337 RepID=A0A0V1FCV3_TRIPS|nr:hypothetical protein T4D_5780 [Trichinella pseudospiralis]